jgi:hypothetical protein
VHIVISCSSQVTDSRSQSSSAVHPKSTPPSGSVLPYAGCCLILYSLVNLFLLSDSSSIGPELFLNRINHLLSLFPLFFVGTALIFANQKRSRLSRSDSPLQSAALWFALILGVIYIACLPVSFLSRHSMIARDASIVNDTRTELNQRKSEILSSIANAQSVNSIATTLSQFPEVRSMRIQADESVDDVRKAISSGVDDAIRMRIDDLKREQSSRRDQYASSVRTTTVGTLIAGCSFLFLFFQLMPALSNSLHRVLRRKKSHSSSRHRHTILGFFSGRKKNK